MEYTLRQIIEHVGPLPILITLGLLLFTVFVSALCLIFRVSIVEVLLNFLVPIYDFALRVKAYINDQIDQAKYSKKVPCDLCGRKHYFYHPTKGVESEPLNICNKCSSNPEGWESSWNREVQKAHQDATKCARQFGASESGDQLTNN